MAKVTLVYVYTYILVRIYIYFLFEQKLNKGGREKEGEEKGTILREEKLLEYYLILFPISLSLALNFRRNSNRACCYIKDNVITFIQYFSNMRHA